MKLMTAVSLSLFLGGAAVAALPPHIAAAAADPARAAQAAQDGARRGPEIVAFAGVRPGDKVIDLIPGGSGYWTRLFAKSVGAKGHVYAVWPTEYLKVDGDQYAPYKAVAAAYPNVSILEQPAAALTAPEKVDLIFTAQNYHDYPDKFMGPVSPAVINKAAYDALKPGGIFLVIDHAGAPGSGMRDIETLHRIDPESAKQQITAAGFRFVGASPLLANPADDHSKLVFDKSIRGRTDQFIYKFQKPR